MTIPKEIKEIVKESGNSFHCRATNYLREKGWYTLVSPYYMDGSTNKPRELDLIAEKHRVYKDRWKGKVGAVIIRLFIECKYISQPNVFWFSDKDKMSATSWLISNTPLPKNNIYTEKHHYLAGSNKVAKLFASKSKQNPENEAIYRALNQSLNAMVYLRKRDAVIKGIPILAEIELPVILCNSFENFYRIEMENPDDTPQMLIENFLLEVNYAYLNSRDQQTNEYFLLDIVDFKKIDSFLNMLESDIDAIFNIL